MSLLYKIITGLPSYEKQAVEMKHLEDPNVFI